jgi:hypothetical protein
MTKQVYSFEQTIEASKDTRGFWLVNHSETIKPYLTSKSKVIGWTDVLAGLENPDSEIFQTTNKLIDLVDAKEIEVFGAFDRLYQENDISGFIKEAYEEMGL